MVKTSPFTNNMTNTHFIESIGVINAFAKNTSLIAQIDQIIEKIVSTYKQDGKVLIFGNGGSAADAQHFAGELVSRFYFDRPALSAFALTTDTSVITAIGNDYGYEQVFSRQVSASAKAEDVVIAISTSGNSKNVLAALAVAKEKGSFTVGLTGHTGGAMKEVCDVCICVPSNSTPRIQECHLIIEHAICAGVESRLFG
jgi:D-sedoheptulose 7-phosphate isomerase